MLLFHYFPPQLIWTLHFNTFLTNRVWCNSHNSVSLFVAGTFCWTKKKKIKTRKLLLMISTFLFLLVKSFTISFVLFGCRFICGANTHIHTVILKGSSVSTERKLKIHWISQRQGHFNNAVVFYSETFHCERRFN